MKPAALALVFLLTTCCAKGSGGPSLRDEGDPSEFADTRSALATRLEADFLAGGYVVARAADGSAADAGDALLWSSLALAALPCDAGAETLAAIASSAAHRGGALVRIEPLPPGYAGNETSRDMELGAAFGLAARAKKCPADYPALSHLWSSHHAYLAAHGGELYPGTGLYPLAVYLEELTDEYFGAGPGGDEAGRLVAETAITGALADAHAGHCYLANLSYLATALMSLHGVPVDKVVKDAACKLSAGLHTALWEAYCGRVDLRDFLRSFVRDEWIFKPQRCGTDTPDGLAVGLTTPGVDYLFSFYTIYPDASKH